MTIQLSTAGRNAMGDALISDLGASPLLRIYSGTAPANVGTALAGNTLLAELAMAATPAPATSGGVVTFNTVTQDSSADATGTASFFRIYKADGTTAKYQGTVATSGADLNSNTVSIVAAGPVAVTSLTLTMPGA